VVLAEVRFHMIMEELTEGEPRASSIAPRQSGISRAFEDD